jgi:fructose 1,6-bisphosphate aldolase/phosphatase
MEVTLSVIKADIGGYVGHSSSHPDVIQKAKEKLERAKGAGLLIDCHVTVCGDDLQLIMTHQQGEDSEKIHKLAWDTFVEGTNIRAGPSSRCFLGQYQGDGTRYG